MQSKKFSRYDEMMSFLPWYYSESKIMNSIIKGDADEIESVRNAINEILNQFYAETATFGINLWEKMLKISVNNEKDLASRRAAVVAKLKKPDTVTPNFLQALVNAHTKDGAGEVRENISDYSVIFTVTAGSIKDSNALFTDIDTYIPAHLGRKIRLRDDLACELFCEATEHDKESLVESFIYNGTATAWYGFAMAAGRYFGRRDVFGAGFRDDMSMHCRAYALCAEFDKEVLVSGD